MTAVARVVYSDVDGGEDFGIVGCCPACREVVTVRRAVTSEMRDPNLGVGVLVAESMLAAAVAAWRQHLDDHRRRMAG